MRLLWCSLVFSELVAGFWVHKSVVVASPRKTISTYMYELCFEDYFFVHHKRKSRIPSPYHPVQNLSNAKTWPIYLAQDGLKIFDFDELLNFHSRRGM